MKYHEDAKSKIKSLYPEAEFSTNDSNNLLVKLNDRLISPILSLDDFELYLSNEKNCIYRVKKRSGTRNLNVIFSIELIQGQAKEDLQVFIEKLNK